LNAFIAAFITDRTFLWYYCTEKYCSHISSRERECSRAINRKEWMPSAEFVFRRLKEEGCVHKNASIIGSFRELIDPSNRTVAENSLACCGLDSISNKLLRVGRLERREMVSLSKIGALFSSAKLQKRANLLFSKGLLQTKRKA
jgi:hypothetical protein